MQHSQLLLDHIQLLLVVEETLLIQIHLLLDKILLQEVIAYLVVLLLLVVDLVDITETLLELVVVIDLVVVLADLVADQEVETIVSLEKEVQELLETLHQYLHHRVILVVRMVAVVVLRSLDLVAAVEALVVLDSMHQVEHQVDMGALVHKC